jgi:hypothetical protein
MFSCLPFLKPKPKAMASSHVAEIPEMPSPRPIHRIPDALLNLANPAIKAQFKKFCRDNNLCVGCSYANPDSPTVLVYNGVLYECPSCDSDVESP